MPNSVRQNKRCGDEHEVSRSQNTCGAPSRNCLSFEVQDEYLAGYESHIVGSAVHQEYWIPAEQLPSFNQAVRGFIEVEAALFGESFVGLVPQEYGLKGKNAEEQFVVLARSWDYSRMDFALEVTANRNAGYLKCLFWAKHKFS